MPSDIVRSGIVCRASGLFLAGVIFTALVAAPTARGADAADLKGAIRLIPDDAAFYSVMLRNREQLDVVLASKAWAELKALPVWKMAWRMAQEQMKKGDTAFPFGDILQIYRLPENRQLLELVGDMTADEIFIYGGKNTVPFVDLLKEAAGGLRYGPLLTQLSNPGGDREAPPRPQIRALLNVLAANLNKLETPDIVLGFKVADKARARTQLRRLEPLVAILVKEHPEFKDSFHSVKLGEESFLTFKFDPTMVPWKQLLEDYEENAGDFRELENKLKSLKSTVGLGLWNDYLVLSVGESLAPLEKLGKGKPLTDRKEFDVLAPHADKRLTSIGYVSKEMSGVVGTQKADLDSWIELANHFLPKADIPAEAQTRIKKDLEALVKDLKRFIPEAGASLEFSFMTPRGQESYAYNWGESLLADGSKPLTILNHVGGDPLVAFAGRGKYDPENYRLLVKWLKVGHRYFEEFALPRLDEEQRQKYDEVAKIALPLLKRMHETTENFLIPALRDSQSAFVLDAKITSKQWVQLLPPSEQPMPMIEIGLLLGVSDEQKLRRAFGAYREIVNEFLAKLHDWDSDRVPSFQIPEPIGEKLKDGHAYHYPIPNFGIDRRLVPTVGVNGEVAFLCLSRQHAERLLARRPLKVQGGPLGDENRVMASAAYVNWAGMVEALGPWVELGVRAAAPFLVSKMKPDGEGAEAPKLDAEILPQVRAVLRLLKVCRTYASSTYFEGGVQVTHSELILQDL